MFSFFKRSSVPNYQYQDPALWRDIFTRKQKRKNDVEVPEFKHLPTFEENDAKEKEISTIELKTLAKF